MARNETRVFRAIHEALHKGPMNANELRKKIAEIDNLIARVEAEHEGKPTQVAAVNKLHEQRTALQDQLDELEAQED